MGSQLIIGIYCGRCAFFTISSHFTGMVFGGVIFRYFQEPGNFLCSGYCFSGLALGVGGVL